MPQLKRRSSRRGGALVMAVMVVAVITVLSAALLQSSLGDSRQVRRSVDQKRAFYVAEAGLAEAERALHEGKLGAVGTREEPARFGGGLVWVEAEWLATEDVLLTSNGLCGISKVQLTRVVERDYLSKVQRGLFSAAELLIGPGTTIDGYDSLVGEYDQQLERWRKRWVGKQEGRIEANGPLTMRGTKAAPAVVSAHLHQPPDTEPREVGEVEHRGDEEELEAELTLPAVRLPAVEVGAPRVVSTPSALPTGDTGLRRLTVQAGGEFWIRGPTRLLVDDLVLLPGGTLRLDASDGPIEIFAAESLELSAGATVETSAARPGDITLQVAGGSELDVLPRAVLEATGRLDAFVYVPSSTVALGAELEFFGGISAAALAIEPGATIHVDFDLSGGGFDDRVASRLRAWRLVDVSDIPRTGAFQDPFHYLGVLDEAARELHQAHELSNTHLHIEYIDLAGVEQDVTVWEDEFDWSGVRAVLDIRRHQKDR